MKVYIYRILKGFISSKVKQQCKSFQCERCEPWYFGDAIEAKSCQECDCNRNGTRECDHQTGQCICFDGVEGEKCDQCKADHYGFRFGGCTDCACSEGSRDTQVLMAKLIIDMNNHENL